MRFSMEIRQSAALAALIFKKMQKGSGWHLRGKTAAVGPGRICVSRASSLFAGTPHPGVPSGYTTSGGRAQLGPSPSPPAASLPSPSCMKRWEMLEAN